jgi:hypothetical protein
MVPNPERIEALLQRIEQAHACRAIHLQTVLVERTADGEILWSGEVEIFQVEGHPKARTAYGWGMRGTDGTTDWVTILGLTPTVDANKAVQAYLMSEP